MMKSIFVALILLCGLSNISRAQDIPSGTLNLLVGPSFHGGFGGMFTAEYEIQMLDDNLTIGPSLGFGMSRYRYPLYDINGRFVTNEYSSGVILHPGVTAHYYFDWLIEEMPSQFDLFAKATGGFWFSSNRNMRSQNYYSPITFGFYAGGRYHFESDWSFYLALGFGTSYANLGLSKSF